MIDTPSRSLIRCQHVDLGKNRLEKPARLASPEGVRIARAILTTS